MWKTLHNFIFIAVLLHMLGKLVSVLNTIFCTTTNQLGKRTILAMRSEFVLAGVAILFYV